MNKLRNTREAVERLLSRARLLGEHLGPILYQLPPSLKCDLGRLEVFLDTLPDDLMHVFEFRNPTWYKEDTFRLLEQKGASLCAHDLRRAESPRKAVGPLAYVRFHGPEGRYHGAYSEQALADWARWLKAEARAGRNIYAYFNNDVEAQAVCDAQTLRKMIRGAGKRRRVAVAYND